MICESYNDIQGLTRQQDDVIHVSANFHVLQQVFGCVFDQVVIGPISSPKIKLWVSGCCEKISQFHLLHLCVIASGAQRECHETADPHYDEFAAAADGESSRPAARLLAAPCCPVAWPRRAVPPCSLANGR